MCKRTTLFYSYKQSSIFVTGLYKPTDYFALAFCYFGTHNKQLTSNVHQEIENEKALSFKYRT